MSKTIFALSTVALSTLALAAALTLAPQTAVHAQNSAIHPVHSCPNDFGIFSSDGYTFTYCINDVVTSSGNTNITFHGSLVAGSTAPSSAVHVDDIPCYIDQNGNIVNGRAIITPSGDIEGSC